jgi:tetratricopeptide (TPR) repeat protein
VATEIWRYWWQRGQYGEGRSWLQRALDASVGADPVLTATAEYAIGNFAAILGDYAAAEKHLQTSIALWRQLGDLSKAAEALSVRGNIALNQLDYEAASSMGEEALQVFREHDDRRGIAGALYDLALVARGCGNYPRALQLLDESMAIWTQVGDTNWIATVGFGLGMTHRLAGDPARAGAALATASELYRRLGDRYGLSSVAIEEGHLAREAGDLPRALALYGEALRYYQAIGYEELIVYCLEFVAAAAAHVNPEVALQLLSAAEAARTRSGFPPAAEHDAKIIESGRELATRAVGDSATRYFEVGRALSLLEAQDIALQFVAQMPRSGKPHASSETASRSPDDSRDLD